MAKCINILILLFFLPVFLYPQHENPSINSPQEYDPNKLVGKSIKFEHLNVEDGLSSNRVYCILQDREGFMWFGTENGLDKYDGYNFTNYQNSKINPKSISHNFIYTIYEDSSGELWIGTYGGGLNKYDRQTDTFIQYLHDPEDKHSISSNIVICIREDKKGNLWIGTEQGGLSFLRKSQKLVENSKAKFIQYQNRQDIGKIFPHNNIWMIYEDSNGLLLMSTQLGGLVLFDPKNQIFSDFTFAGQSDYANNTTNFIYADPDLKDEKVFICNKQQLNIINLINRKNRFYQMPRTDGPTSINKMEQGIYWIGTPEGILIYDDNKEKFIAKVDQYSTGGSLNNNFIIDIYKDNSKRIWVATIGGGVQIYDRQKYKFSHQKLDIKSNENNQLCHISAIFEDLAENGKILWIATSNQGLIKYHREKGILKQYKNIPATINSIYQDPKELDLLWFATFGKGLWRMNKIDEIFLNHTIYTGTKKWDPNRNDNYSNRFSRSIIKDQKGNLWLAASIGLFLFDRQTEHFIPYIHDPNHPGSLSDNYILSLYEDKAGIIWIGTRTKGVNKFNPNADTFTHYESKTEDSLSISSNWVNTIYEDKSGILWFGTRDGLNRFEKINETFVRYGKKNGLPGVNIKRILEDENGNLWISTNNGLSRFNPQSETFRNYDIEDGLQSKEFIRECSHKSEGGEMFFGGKNGFNAFYPDSIKDNQHVPSVVITDFKIFNKSILPGTNSPLKKSISVAKEIILAYDQSVFSFEFAALDYRAPGKNKYKHKMDGVDPDWMQTDASRRFATYTNLDPGEYVFRVKGSNNDGIWNEKGTSINITITPPWWRTTLAYTFYFLLLSTIVIGTWRIQLRRIHIKQQLEMEHFEAENLRKVDKMKSIFFANISHEFRTPLTLIKGPAKQMLEGKFIGNLKEQYKMIVRNSDRLLGLINQILDLSKLESGEIKLKVTEIDIVKYIKGLVLSFASLAERKKISLKFDVKNKNILGYVDRDKMEKIVTNLLSNAFKFTPENGVVDVVITTKAPTPSRFSGHPSEEGNSVNPLLRGDKGVCKDCVKINISNTGLGIPADQLDKIFDRFYQADDNYKKDSEGSGIGLALTKELVEVCHGEISVQSENFSEHGKGEQPPQSPAVGGSDLRRDPFKKGEVTTVFTVILPIAKEYFKEDEIIKEAETANRIPEAGKLIPNEDENILVKPELEKRSPASSLHSPLLLIVEDNPDVTSYICSFMEKDYRIFTAENGKIGLKKALDKYPDLIISDVMMPEMDGFELCKKIKSDERISHIPVILLTAKADLNSKIEGLEFGADDYINKPFEADELKIRSKNLIEQRKKLREKFARLTELQPNEIAITSIDEEFLKRLITVFENHISEPEFSTEQCAREVGMSRSSLNNKLRALTNQSTHEFIRSLRLKHAAKLLKKAAGSVAEIAYQVGFNNTSHFAKAFRQHFGQSPSDFSNHNNSVSKHSD